MTVAVCFKCGCVKFGAFTPCQACGAEPRSDDELAVSLAMTDHYLGEDDLRRVGQNIKEGNPPVLSESNHQVMLEALRKLRSVPVFAKLMARGKPSERTDVE